jgi:hypothetical protein
MFVGHYAVGFFLKRKVREMPLWLLFVAVQFVDILAFILVLLGVERMRYNPVDNPFLRTFIEYVPFSHSLSGNVIIALPVFLVFRKLKGRAWGIALSLAVLSHWFIDFAAHTRDMPLVFDRYKVGLGLWNFPWTAFLLEVGFFVGAGYYLFRDAKSLRRPVILMALVVVCYAPAMFAPEGEVPVTVVSMMSLGFYALFAGVAWWVERKKGRAPS